jgi:hypothetical protein
LKQGVVQYVESLKNTGATAMTANLVVNVRLGNQAQSIVSDQGKPLGGSLAEKESGFLVVSQAGVPSPLFMLGGPKAKVRPIINNQNNFQFTVAYSLSVAPGRSATPDAKALAALFKPLKQPGLLNDLPADVRRSIQNGTGETGFGFGSDIELPDAFAELATVRGPHDTLLVGEDTRLRGSLIAQQLSISTAHGSQKLPIEKVAAISGGNMCGRTNRLVLRDGQVLVGPIQEQELKFTLNSGLDAVCSLASLDRFVLREQPGDGEAGPKVFAYVDLPSGDRLAIVPGEQQTITAVTPWGNRAIPLNDIELLSISGPSQGTAGHRLVLVDGSSFVAFLSQGTLELTTANFGVKQFNVMEMQRIRAARYKTGSNGPTPPVTPHAVLAGGNLLIGQLDLPILHFDSQGQAIPIAPPQIKVLRRHEADDSTSGIDRTLYRAELWDGDVIVAAVREQTLPLRTGSEVLQVPLADIVELRVPTPTVPESLRARISELLADLGHTEWRRRESASKELLALGAIAQELCQDALQHATDPEVRKRVQDLLDAMKE